MREKLADEARTGPALLVVPWRFSVAQLSRDARSAHAFGRVVARACDSIGAMRRDLKWRRRLAAMAAGALAFALFQLLALFPGVTDAVYSRGIGPLLASPLSSLTGIVPISLAELLVVGFIVRQLWGLGTGIAQVRNHDRRLGNALAAGVLRFGADVGVVVALFYVLWGFHYARPPLEARQQWGGREAGVEEIARLAQEMVEAANFEYAGLTLGADLGRPTATPGRDELLEQLEAGWEGADGVLGPQAAAIAGFGAPKPLLASRLLDYGLTSGFYFPWTAEANYNAGTPAVSLPQAIAHEMSHQRGYAPEDEANFAGYLAAAMSPGAYPRYSAYVFAQQQLLGVLGRADRERATILVRLRLPGVQRDIDAARRYWEQFEGPASRAASSMNDAYLRTNRVPGGIASYGRSVELLIGYARSRGGWLAR
jgi:hypothetical protein